MTTTRVLVAYGTKNGATAEIAEAIGEALRQAGLAADVQLAKKVRDVTPYQAVIIGSSLYAGTWRRGPVRLLRKYRRLLAERSVWVFHSGPLPAEEGGGIAPEDMEQPLPKSVAELATEIGAHDVVTFGGYLGPETPGFIAKAMYRNGRGGDFRDFDRIRAWATGIAGEIVS
jgi:menaquinone-dependent protoporphyrinogen oxidase